MHSYIRPSALKRARGYALSSLYRDIDRGLLPRPVKISIKAVGWPANEIAAIDEALIAGNSPDEIRKLVKRLEAARELKSANIKPIEKARARKHELAHA